jgi:hypothetical protein
MQTHVLLRLTIVGSALTCNLFGDAVRDVLCQSDR